MLIQRQWLGWEGHDATEIRQAGFDAVLVDVYRADRNDLLTARASCTPLGRLGFFGRCSTGEGIDEDVRAPALHLPPGREQLFPFAVQML